MFPQRLKELRKSRRVSQRALAAALGVTQQAVGKWEMGRSTPDPATIARIADFFGASADYLLGCSGQRQRAAFSAGGEQYVSVPIIGTVKAGYDALAFEEDYGSAVADVHNPQEYFYLLVRGDSMEPQISDGDLALVRRQTDVESGQLLRPGPARFQDAASPPDAGGDARCHIALAQTGFFSRMRTHPALQTDTEFQKGPCPAFPLQFQTWSGDLFPD